MKKIQISLLVAVMAWTSSSFSVETSAPAAAVGKVDEKKSPTYSGRGYSITYPENWTWEPNYQGLDVFGMAPPQAAGSMANLSVISGPISDETVDKLVEKNLTDLRGGLQNFELVETGKAAFDGFTGKRLIYNHAMNGHQLRVVQYFIVQNNKLFIITATTTIDEYPHYFNTFEKIAKTFKIKS